MANCPGCGGMLHYDIKKKKVVCEYCSAAYNPRDLDVNDAAENQTMGACFFTCPNCGGEIFSTDQNLTGRCSYCGSPVTFQSRMEQTRRPDFIIPFERTKEDCRDNYIAAVKKSFFAGKDLGEEEYVREFRGIYMPYWVKKIRHTGDARAYVTEIEKVGDYSVTDINRLIYHLDVTYDDLNHDAASSFSDDISERVEPFELLKEGESTLQPFYPSYLTGFYAEAENVAEEEYRSYFHQMAIESTDLLLAEQKDLVGKVPPDDHVISFYDSIGPIDKKALDGELDQMVDRDKILEEKSKHELMKLLKKEEKERDLLEKDFEKASSGKKMGQKDDETLQNKYGYQIEEEAAKLALFPLWFLSYRKGKRVNYIAMNGQTGRVCADLPINMKKVFAVAALISLLLFLLFDRFTFLPYQVCILTIWMEAVLLMMLKDEQAVITEHEAGIVMHKERGNIDSNAANKGSLALALFVVLFLAYKGIGLFEPDITIFTQRIPMVIYGLIGTGMAVYELINTFKDRHKESQIKGTFMYYPVFFSVLFNMAVLLINPVSDYFFYGAASIGLICIPISMIYMILRFNLVISRPIPQFERR